MHLAGGVARYSGECSMTVLTQPFQESASVVVSLGRPTENSEMMCLSWKRVLYIRQSLATVITGSDRAIL